VRRIDASELLPADICPKSMCSARSPDGISEKQIDLIRTFVHLTVLYKPSG
jgi:hypothetical protein